MNNNIFICIVETFIVPELSPLIRTQNNSVFAVTMTDSSDMFTKLGVENANTVKEQNIKVIILNKNSIYKLAPENIIIIIIKI